VKACFKSRKILIYWQLSEDAHRAIWHYREAFTTLSSFPPQLELLQFALRESLL